MDQGKSGPSDSSAATVEAAGQVAASSLQLLSMLDVVHDWDRGDAISVGDAAQQTESLTRSIGARLVAGQGELDRALRTLEAVVVRAERLARVAPAQARDDASGGAMASALRRLAAASDELRGHLEAAESRLPADTDPTTTPRAGSA
ncbi:MAG: hypothetical protein REJ24_21885 [Rhodocyclaceae bacterium]|nr:hypothetical protein [Pseudomonadota bacterium]MDQ7975244.1 hypothetical protein [Rhodocyclaceae bacterium]MDQ8002329.1 hypothetical protein [Pseudomonadota bacterium]MDQ8017236.1 hypothetical protein [Pseudomonadota bacterium]